MYKIGYEEYGIKVIGIIRKERVEFDKTANRRRWYPTEYAVIDKIVLHPKSSLRVNFPISWKGSYLSLYEYELNTLIAYRQYIHNKILEIYNKI